MESLFSILASLEKPASQSGKRWDVQPHSIRDAIGVPSSDAHAFSSDFNPAILPQHPLLGYKQAGRLATTTNHPPPLVLRRVSLNTVNYKHSIL